MLQIYLHVCLYMCVSLRVENIGEKMSVIVNFVLRVQCDNEKNDTLERTTARLIIMTNASMEFCAPISCDVSLSEWDINLLYFGRFQILLLAMLHFPQQSRLKKMWWEKSKTKYEPQKFLSSLLVLAFVCRMYFYLFVLIDAGHQSLASSTLLGESQGRACLLDKNNMWAQIHQPILHGCQVSIFIARLLLKPSP